MYFLSNDVYTAVENGDDGFLRTNGFVVVVVVLFNKMGTKVICISAAVLCRASRAQENVYIRFVLLGHVALLMDECSGWCGNKCWSVIVVAFQGQRCVNVFVLWC